MSEVHDRVAASFNKQGLMTTIGAKLALVSDGEVHITLPFSEKFSQQHGYVHGWDSLMPCRMVIDRGSLPRSLSFWGSRCRFCAIGIERPSGGSSVPPSHFWLGCRLLLSNTPRSSPRDPPATRLAPFRRAGYLTR